MEYDGLITKPSLDELYHHGILGQKWGHRNGPPYPLGSDVSTGKRLKSSGKKVFVSGSSKTQDKSSAYYRKKLPKGVRKELDQKIKSGDTIIVGDAPGIDRQVQDYLKKKHYRNVEVYSPGKEARYLADKKWKNNLIDAPEFEPGSSEWLAKKDKAMQKVADEGIAVILDQYGAGATRNNINQLIDTNKNVSIYELNSKARHNDILTPSSVWNRKKGNVDRTLSKEEYSQERKEMENIQIKNEIQALAYMARSESDPNKRAQYIKEQEQWKKKLQN